MGEKTTIGWTNATQNFWRGCDKVSPGCAKCYMFRDQERYGRDPSVVVRSSDGTFFAPVRASKWRRMPPQTMVFTCSWSDFNHEDADPWREEAWDVIRQRPDLTWQILTKRPERFSKCLPSDWGDGWPNVWLGVSVENRRFVERVDFLRETPAAVRFISAEPLLGPLVARFVPEGLLGEWVWPDGKLDIDVGTSLDLTDISWVICGGETGPGRRTMKIEWVRDLYAECRRANVAFFMKQDGGPRPDMRGRIPDDLWVRQYPARSDPITREPDGALF